MPRKLRIQYPGAMYHVMSRGNRRERIFLDDMDWFIFYPTPVACQPRQLRDVRQPRRYPGGTYQLLSRSNRREKILLHHVDRL